MGIRDLFTRGTRHQKLLDTVDIRIVVSGVRGKSSTVKRLHDILHQRGHGTLAKITGDFPFTIENGEQRPIERHGPRVTLYENRTILRDTVPKLTKRNEIDALLVDHPIMPNTATVFENQAITEYTMRMFNNVFVKPQVIIFTNIRQDHNDTLGSTRQRIARSFARSVPEDTHVISGEQHEIIHEYLRTELKKRDASIEQVSIPERHRRKVGAETIHILNAVLRYYDKKPLPAWQIDQLLANQQPSWIRLNNGKRIFNAAKVNDIESTELFRRQLAGTGASAEKVCPFVFLRSDRRGRTASFVEYINILNDRDLINQVHVGGAFTGVFARNINPRAIEHNTEQRSAATVLDRLVEEELPIFLMGNTVHPWMRDLQAEINTRRESPFEFPGKDTKLPTHFFWGSQELETWKRIRGHNHA